MIGYCSCALAFAAAQPMMSSASGQIDCAEPAEPLNTRCFEKQSKTIKMTSGGARPGAGRKAGTPNRRKHSAPHYNLDSAASHLSRDS